MKCRLGLLSPLGGADSLRSAIRLWHSSFSTTRESQCWLHLGSMPGSALTDPPTVLISSYFCFIIFHRGGQQRLRKVKQQVEGCIASRWQSVCLSGPELFLTSEAFGPSRHWGKRLVAFLEKLTWLPSEGGGCHRDAGASLF